MQTPGPWTWDEQDGYVVGPPGAGVVAYDVGHDENGRLIAAAPDLLEACLYAERNFGRLDAKDVTTGQACWEVVHAVIAKARGESASAPNPERAEGASR